MEQKSGETRLNVEKELTEPWIKDLKKSIKSMANMLMHSLLPGKRSDWWQLK